MSPFRQKRALQAGLLMFRAQVEQEKQNITARCEAMRAELELEVQELRRELSELRDAHEELRCVSLARGRAYEELAALHRRRAIIKAEAAVRDENMKVN
jgi:hypothetical protein